jgi:hypothetical protein
VQTRGIPIAAAGISSAAGRLYGSAALTLHRLLQMHPSHTRLSPDGLTFEDEIRASATRDRWLRELRVILVDECWLALAQWVDALDRGCRRVTADPRPFGNKIVIFIGDPLQQSAVLDDAAYHSSRLPVSRADIAAHSFSQARVFRGLHVHTFTLANLQRRSPTTTTAWIDFVHAVGTGDLTDIPLKDFAFASDTDVINGVTESLPPATAPRYIVTSTRRQMHQWNQRCVDHLKFINPAADARTIQAIGEGAARPGQQFTASRSADQADVPPPTLELTR